MKHIKLFESFSGLKPEEILKDIKTISYILEDGGYDIRYFYNISQPFSGVRSINSDELEGMIDAGHYKRSKIKWNSIYQKTQVQSSKLLVLEAVVATQLTTCMIRELSVLILSYVIRTVKHWIFLQFLIKYN